MRILVVMLGLGAASTGCRFNFEATSDPTAGDARTVDAPEPPGDAGICVPAACAAAGGSCVGSVCEIVASSEQVAQCPSGMPCRLVCAGFRFCRDGARCDGATWCAVECVGYRTCQDGVSCGDAACLVTCNGEEACEAGIQVGPAGSCTSHCCGTQACAGGVGTCTNDATCS